MGALATGVSRQCADLAAARATAWTNRRPGARTDVLMTSSDVSYDPYSALPFRGGELIADKYRVDSLLGAGGMGFVFSATHVDLDRKVAIKLIRPELASDEAQVERLLLEARAAARIRSEHVGKVLDVARLPNGAPYIVMEMLEGCDLSVYLEHNGRLPSALAVDLVLQACEALSEAHAARIVHRDLKPENLFVTENPDGTRSIKVLDFGISKELGDATRRALTNPTTAVGSPQYMAPEQMRAEAIDTRVDIWAIGAILFELLSGQKAFDADTLPAVCARVLGDNPPPLSSIVAEVPAGLSELVARCLAKNLRERVQTVVELAEYLAPYGSGQAQHSVRRIRATSGPQGATAVEFAQTLMAGDSVDRKAAFADVTPVHEGQTATAEANWSDSESLARRGPLWPVFLGAAAAAGLGIFLWSWSRVPPERARTAAARGVASSFDPPLNAPTLPATPAQSAPQIPAPPTTTVRSELTGSVPNVTPEPSASGNMALGASSSSLASTSNPSGTAVAAPAPKRANKPSTSQPRTITSGDAWDPNNFGSRH